MPRLLLIEDDPDQRRLRALLLENDGRLIEAFPEKALHRIWKAQHFSWWMTSMLHVAPDASDFDRLRQLGELQSVVESEAGRRFLAEQTRDLALVQGRAEQAPGGGGTVLAGQFGVPEHDVHRLRTTDPEDGVGELHAGRMGRFQISGKNAGDQPVFIDDHIDAEVHPGQAGHVLNGGGLLVLHRSNFVIAYRFSFIINTAYETVNTAIIS